jgi:CCR4-NOT transcription complex subunit 6
VPQLRNSTPTRRRLGSYADEDDNRSVDSARSGMSNYNTPGTPREITVGGLNNTPRTNNAAYIEYGGGDSEEWVEISRDQIYVPNEMDIGRKLKVEAAAYSMESGELLMHRVVKTDLVLSRTPVPDKRNLVTAKPAGGGGARFRIVTYNILAEIYATQQQYPHADLWSLSWDFR